jgi:hypothetical protein
VPSSLLPPPETWHLCAVGGRGGSAAFASNQPQTQFHGTIAAHFYLCAQAMAHSQVLFACLSYCLPSATVCPQFNTEAALAPHSQPRDGVLSAGDCALARSSLAAARFARQNECTLAESFIRCVPLFALNHCLPSTVCPHLFALNCLPSTDTCRVLHQGGRHASSGRV